MTNQTTTVKCPTCGTPATQTIKLEECSLSKNGIHAKIEELVSYCIVPAKLTKFHKDENAEDPCILCPKNRITEIPGSFLHMEDGSEPNTWHELHLCPHCQSKYSVDTRKKATTLL